MIEIIIAALLAAVLSGALGYTVAVVRRDTAIALLKQGHETIEARLDRLDTTIVAQNEKIDRHLKVIVRLIVDAFRKSGVDMRTADVLEITALTEDQL